MEHESKKPNRKLTKQQIKKRFDGECLVCQETKYELLDAHRIVEGGTYHPINVITLCTGCHRLAHQTDEIKFDRKYNSTAGLMLHWWYHGEERWTPVKN